jgi:hypothetical protein
VVVKEPLAHFRRNFEVAALVSVTASATEK